MFELEKEINRWKKNLKKQESFEDGLAAEFELHLRDVFETAKNEGLSDEEAFRKAEAQVGSVEAIAAEYGKNRVYGRNLRSPASPMRFMPAFVGNYLKIASRRLKRHKASSFLTIAGLAVGMAAFFLIVLYSGFERSYDDFHRFGDRIFRVENARIRGGSVDRSAACPPALGPVIETDIPGVEDSVRLLNVASDSNIVSRVAGGAGDAPLPVSGYEKRIFYADTSFFRIFSFPLLRGDASTALAGPDAVVLTESTSRKYFGDEDPLQKTVSVTTRFGRFDYRVAAVCRDVPPNSHLRFDLLLPFAALEAAWPSLGQQMWNSNGFLTYLLLSPSTDPGAVEEKFPALIQSHPLQSASFTREFRLQSLRSIHLTSRLRLEADVNGDLKTVVFLQIVGLFILLIAWLNFINLTTARSLARGKEVGIRKTIGAERGQLVGQFLLEAAFQNFLAFVLALGIVIQVLPAFSRLIGKPLSLTQSGSSWIWMAVAFLAGAALSGIGPALLLSSFKPAFVLRGRALSGPKGQGLRKGLVLVQFAMAVFLIASTLVVERQLAFVRNRSLGADIDRTLALMIPRSPDTAARVLTARDKMAGLAAIDSAAAASSIPGRPYSNSISGVLRSGASEEEAQSLSVIDVDEKYFPAFGIPLLAGRNFSPGLESDEDTVILNEEAAGMLGFESPEKAILGEITAFGDRLRIVGVTANYHHKSLREKIEPVVFFPHPYSRFPGTTYLSLKIRGTAMGEALSQIRSGWSDFFPGLPFTSFFLDDDFRDQYDADERFGRLFGLASVLAIIIACLGLSGLASFAAERRTREIGIRKVFGATVPGLTGKLSQEFVSWILPANLIAWPAVWIAMNRWLSGFAYRTRVGLGTLAMSAGLVLAIALLTVAAKAAKAAAARPAESLRAE
ncbi:MAG: ABC transporter permease [Candidatus Aminicenantes bacterium]|nr:ABC transporter permease [Candidatus Aminicenantes bacterium]